MSDPKNEVIEPTDQTDQSGEQDEEKVVLSKEEFEKLNKKASDFERSIELKRLAKLQELPENKNVDEDEVKGKLSLLEGELASMKAAQYNNSLREAYKEFVKEYPWTDSDEVFSKIKENFKADGADSKDELLRRLKSATQIAFPTEYEKHLEDKIKARVMSDSSIVNGGGNAPAADILHKDTPAKTEEDMRRERLGSMLRQNITWLPKKN